MGQKHWIPSATSHLGTKIVLNVKEISNPKLFSSIKNTLALLSSSTILGPIVSMGRIAN